MIKEIQTRRRWLRAVIAASAEPLPNFPWMRSERRRPAAMVAPAAEEAPPRPAKRPASVKVALFGRRSSAAAR